MNNGLAITDAIGGGVLICPEPGGEGGSTRARPALGAFIPTGENFRKGGNHGLC